MTATLSANASVLDGRAEGALADHHVRVEDGLIREVSDRPLRSSSARTVDLDSRTLTPGLIDCHGCVIATVADLGRDADLPNRLVALRSARISGAC